MEPLTKKEKIYTLALSIPLFLKRGDKDAFKHAVQHLMHIVDRGDFEELKELARRHKDTPKMTQEEFMDKAQELTTDIIGNIAQDMDIDTPLHMMSVKEQIYHTAIGIGKATKEVNAQTAADGSVLLAHLVTEKEIKESQEAMSAAFTKCGCKCCLAQLELITEIKKMDEDPEPETEDPWKAFGA